MRVCLLLPGLVMAVPAAAQRQDGQAWLQVNTNVPVDARTRVTLEQIGRVGDRAGGLFQTEFGALLTRKLSTTVEIAVGYRKVGMHNSAARNEDRIRQHLIATFGRVTTRLRVDERFHPAGDEIGFRIRPLIRYNLPVGPRGLALFVSHESFWLPNATRWGQRRGYERMRNIVGVALPIGRNVAADIGYLNQLRLPRTGTRGQMDHAVSVQLTINPFLAPRADD